MRKLLVFPVASFFLPFIFISCDNSKSVSLIELKAGDSVINDVPAIVPIETALEKLYAFMDSTNLAFTKSGNSRIIENVETHYSKNKSYTKSGEIIPDSYIVNFTQNEGFAVLGANTAVTSIVAVSEQGNLESGFLDIDFDDIQYTEDIDGNIIDLDTLNLYSEEYGDYYVMRMAKEKAIIQECLSNGIAAGSGSSTSSTVRYATTGIGYSYFNHSTNWAQGKWDERGVYNRYCYKVKAIKGKKYVLAGCSTTAMATIVAFNEYPTNLYVLGKKVDYKTIKSVKDPLSKQSTEEIKEGVGLLFGSIFHSVDPLFCLKKGTCITPEEIKRCFQTFGYENVKKYEDSSFSSSLKKAASDMLKNGKPVFISSMKKHNPLGGHSWVIDGSCYDDDTWMVHCDWGWGGECNGFYSSGCLKPKSVSDAKEYGEYTWHFRVVTYDVPTDNHTFNMSFN